jgi:DNA-binding protein Fis
MDAFAIREHDAISVGKEFQRHGLDNVFGEVELSPLSSSESLDYPLGSLVGMSNRLPSERPLGASQVTSSTALDATYAPGVLAHSADSQAWERLLEHEANALLAQGLGDVWDILSKRFEAKLIQTALSNTRGRRIEAAQKLGIGRNTITRKIQELGLED